MEILNRELLLPNVDKVLVSVNPFRESSKVLEFNHKENNKLLVSIINGKLYLHKVVGKKLMILDYALILGDGVGMTISLHKINDTNFILFVSDDDNTELKTYTIFDGKFVETYRDNEQAPEVYKYIDELWELTFVDKLLSEYKYRETKLIVSEYDIPEGSVLIDIFLLGNNVYSIVEKDGDKILVMYDYFTYTDTITLSTNSNIVYGEEDVYIVTEDNNEIVNSNT